VSDSPKPLDADVLAVLGAAGPLTEVPDAARLRMRAAVEARIAALAGPASSQSSDPNENAGPAGSQSSDPNENAGPAGGRGSRRTAAPRLAARAWVASHPWLSLLAAFVLGSVVGVVGRGMVPQQTIIDIVVAREPKIVPVEIPIPVPFPSDDVTTAPAQPIASAPAPATTPPPATAPQRTAAAPNDSEQQLAAESALLDVARTALARGEPDRALEAVGRHVSQFPRGLLSEEREALAIKALALAGRGEEARDRAARFRERYPVSMFLRSIDASLKTVR
jgi:hypothetical protein